MFDRGTQVTQGDIAIMKGTGLHITKRGNYDITASFFLLDQAGPLYSCRIMDVKASGKRGDCFCLSCVYVYIHTYILYTGA